MAANLVQTFADGTSSVFYERHVGVQPDLFAQVTMIDGGVGDCNIVDICQYPNNEVGSRNEAQWRRTLVDTGIWRKDGTVAYAIRFALKKRALPAPNSTQGLTYTVPPLSQIQISHFDQDHIGNAGRLIEDLKEKGYFEKWTAQERAAHRIYRCESLYSGVPAPFPSLVAKYKTGLNDGGIVALMFEITGFRRWKEQMQAINIETVQMLTYDPRLEFRLIEPRQEFPEYTVCLGWSLEMISEQIEAFKNRDQIPAPDEELQFRITLGSEFTNNNRIIGNAEYYIFKFSKRKILAWVLSQWVEDEPAFKQIVVERGYTEEVDELYRKYVDGKDLPWMLLDPSKPGYKEELGFMLNSLWNSRNYFVHSEPTIQQTWSVAAVGGIFGPPQRRSQITLAPTPKVVVDLSRYLVADALNDASQPGDGIIEQDVAEAVLNRASVVTNFVREDLDLQMLFTGDAYEQTCDLQNTVAGWKGFQSVYPMFFDILKIPHHGSSRTTTSDFYEQVRAEVYLVSAAHSVHGNPKLSTLKTIVEGFRGKTRPSGLPFRLFCSNPDALEDSPSQKSAIRALAQYPQFQPSVNLPYQIWRLKSDSNVEYYLPNNRGTIYPKNVAWGSIVFYRDQNSGGLAETFDFAEWELCTAQY